MSNAEILSYLSQYAPDRESFLKMLVPVYSGFSNGFKSLSTTSANTFVLRPYQVNALNPARLQSILWSRQIGKTVTLSFFALIRCLCIARHTVLFFSVSKKNVEEVLSLVEFFVKVDGLKVVGYKRAKDKLIFANGSQIVSLAANTRTARGWSGDLILDEFAYYRDVANFWQAVLPIISTKDYYRCIICSTPNGDNLFAHLCNTTPCNRLSRSEAFDRFGVPIYSLRNGDQITPEEAREESTDKMAYDNAFELAFNVGVSRPVIRAGVISATSGEVVSEVTHGSEFFAVGVDVGSKSDYTVFWGLDNVYNTVSVCVLKNQKIDIQALTFCKWCGRADSVVVDTTGLGVGFFDMIQRKYRRVLTPLNFAAQQTLNGVRLQSREMLGILLERNAPKISVPDDPLIRRCLGAPYWTEDGKVCTPHIDGHHCDFFWALALANFGAMMRRREFSR